MVSSKPINAESRASSIRLPMHFRGGAEKKSSAVGVRPVLDAQNLNGVRMIVKDDAVNADPQRKLRRIGALEPLAIAVLGLDETR